MAIISPTSLNPVVFDKRLREMNFGDWEGQTYERLKHLHAYREWLDHPQDVTPPSGESWEQFQGRLTDFMDSLAYRMQEENDDTISASSALIVTHGGVIRQMSSMLIPGVNFWDVTINPASLLSLKVTLYEGQWVGRC
ncbi:putative phosphoserine phosphatase 2 [compost metagenome]